ncbi:protein NETWORKED 4A-like [Hibiscus syriacus]|uniref:protein NETWORKED 4A-like n=1 Tax=Hibiscus syriacus TaxID=106335 RepID=UPI0019225B40|nr:protein NETWORKED 4A-like [Hibiscus syriacus]XP_038992998.1 protein NETWORKED 4A-like [Hibiscus syriacus]XP_038992999.1 protein NETWORKED 4A-like [Hibiscus syriacus]
MANSSGHLTKSMKRLKSRKSHSWWWDSHISPKNSRWVAENVEEMDRNVKQMLKLIEDDGDSFARKAEMYYQRRPELVSHVEEFYRMYRSLAERYDHLTGELRRNIPSDLQSQGSDISDITSDLPSIWPASDQRLSRRKSGPRAAGFSVFLGSGGSNVYQKEEDELSTRTDSETESDASSVNNYSVLSGNGSDQGVNRKMVELEIELHEVKQKLRMLEEENSDGSVRGAKNNTPELLARIREYEEKLEIANSKIQLTEEKVPWLRIELQKYKPLEAADSESSEEESVKMHRTEQIDVNQALDIENKNGISEKDNKHAHGKMQVLVEELSITKEILQGSEKEIASLKLEMKQSYEKIQKLQGQLDTAQREIVTWKSKLNTEKREVSKLQGRIAMLKNSLSDRDHEIRDLKIAVSDAEQKIFPEKAHIKAEISKLLEGRICLEEQLRDWEARGRSLEDDIRKAVNDKRELEERLRGEIEHLKLEIAERSDCIKVLNENLETLKAERDVLENKIVPLKAEISSRDNQIVEIDKHLHELNVEHVKLIASAEGANKLVEKLQSKTKELEDVIERQRITILVGAEEKREAIRQLCFSLEHYQDRYHWLRQAFMGQKRVPVLTT